MDEAALLAFRPLSRSDFPLLERWLARPHVDAWWRQPLDLAGLEAKYGRRVDGLEPTFVFLIEYAGRPIGWIQWYRWSDHTAYAEKIDAEPQSAGIDISIGEEDMIGKGVGPAAIRKFLAQYVFVHADIRAVLSDPETNNRRSLAAFAKAGFAVTRTLTLPGEDCRRSLVRLERNAF